MIDPETLAALEHRAQRWQKDLLEVDPATLLALIAAAKANADLRRELAEAKAALHKRVCAQDEIEQAAQKFCDDAKAEVAKAKAREALLRAVAALAVIPDDGRLHFAIEAAKAGGAL